MADTRGSQKNIRRGKPCFAFRERLRDLGMLSDLVHKFGHDIGNPLTSVISYASVLERLATPGQTAIESSPEKTIQFAQSIGAEAWKVSHIMERLVLLLSERAGDTMETDVGQTLDRIVTKLRNRYGLTGVQLSITRPPEPVYAAVDPEQLLSLLTELTLNAWEAEQAVRGTNANDSAPVTISIGAIDDTVEIQFSNRAPANAAEKLDSLFELFVKFPEEKRALGVGLTVCEAIVSRHHGSIELKEETENSQTTWTVTVHLPRAAESTP